LRLVSDEPEAPGGQQGDLVSRLRVVIAAKDEQIAGLTAGLEAALSGLEAARERERRLELRLAEAERRLGMDSSDSGTPGSKERIGAKEARRARRRESERERSQDRKRGGQPRHKGKAWPGIRTLMTARTLNRRRNAVPAIAGWTARMPWSPGGRRSSTWK
jgi:hypothetical protein